MSWSSLPRGYDKADCIPMNPFQNESFKHASERLTKKKYKKRVLCKGWAKKFCKTKKGNRGITVSIIIK